MADSEVDVGKSPFPVPAWRPSCGLGCLLVSAVLGGILLIFGVGYGLALPSTNWYEITQVQAFEGDAGVVLFVEVDWWRQNGGAFSRPPSYLPVELIRVDVSPDGRVN